MKNNLFILVLVVAIIVFMTSLYVLLLQVFGIQSSDKSTLLSGILSMIGGFGGAIGAYFVATFQMNRKFEHEKKKADDLVISKTKKSLLKLRLLNEYAIKFVGKFVEDFSGSVFNDEISFKIKSAETAILWIQRKTDDVNDDLLEDGFMLDYIRLNKLINHVYNEITVFNNLPEEQKAHNINGLIKVLDELKKDLLRFEEYVDNQLKVLY